MWLSLQMSKHRRQSQAQKFKEEHRGLQDRPVRQSLRRNHNVCIRRIQKVLPFQFYSSGSSEIFVVEFHVVSEHDMSKQAAQRACQANKATHTSRRTSKASCCLQSICNGKDYSVGVHDSAVEKRVNIHSKQQQTHRANEERCE